MKKEELRTRADRRSSKDDAGALHDGKNSESEETSQVVEEEVPEDGGQAARHLKALNAGMDSELRDDDYIAGVGVFLDSKDMPTSKVSKGGVDPRLRATVAGYLSKPVEVVRKPRTDLECLLTYARDMANSIGLKDWHIEYSAYEPVDNALAQIVPTIGRKVAGLRLCTGFFNLSLSEQRDTVLHELLHLHHVNAADVVRVDLADTLALPKQMIELVYNSLERQLEYGNDGLCMAISHMFPLPEYDK